MKLSTDRILTTHVGSLPRPRAILDLIAAREAGQPLDEAAFEVHPADDALGAHDAGLRGATGLRGNDARVRAACQHDGAGEGRRNVPARHAVLSTRQRLKSSLAMPN